MKKKKRFVRIAVALRLLDANALAMLQEHNRLPS